jgi:hypothetical protein
MSRDYEAILQEQDAYKMKFLAELEKRNLHFLDLSDSKANTPEYYCIVNDKSYKYYKAGERYAELVNIVKEDVPNWIVNGMDNNISIRSEFMIPLELHNIIHLFFKSQGWVV